jgi:hypothetical protein
MIFDPEPKISKKEQFELTILETLEFMSALKKSKKKKPQKF